MSIFNHREDYSHILFTLSVLVPNFMNFSRDPELSDVHAAQKS